MPSRRAFLKQTVALALGAKPFASAVAAPDEDWFLLESGCLTCAGERRGRQWKLTFTVWIERRRKDGASMNRRLVPSVLLKQRLAQIGQPTFYDGHPLYPVLVGFSSLAPAQLRKRMASVIADCDWATLYTNPEPWEWRNF
jgi:hypothetical protein